MMTHAGQFCRATLLAATFMTLPAWAGDITTEWASVKPPPAPQLKAVTVDPKTTAVQGAVAGSTQGATERGYKAIVPVDGMSSEDAYNEQYAAWHLAKGGPVALVEHVTVTRSDLIKFGD